MTKRLSLGRHLNGGRGLRISAPGENVDTGRLLFSSDIRFAQVLFRMQAAMSVNTVVETIQFPGQPAFNIVNVYGYVNLVFPSELSFRPYCQITHSYSEDGAGQRYVLGRTIDVEVNYTPYTTSVEVNFYKRTSGDTHIGGLICGAAVFNMPVDGAA